MPEDVESTQQFSEREIAREWSALPPRRLPGLLRDFRGEWWLAGGWSLDMWMGRPSRLHEDTDIVVFREHVPALLAALPNWIFVVSDPPGTLRPWVRGEQMPAGCQDIWGRHPSSDLWQLQIMAIDGDEETWRFRRDHRVTGPRASMGWWSGDLPVLAPEIQLLYKAKPQAQRRPKDTADLRRIVPRLPCDRRQWLEKALEIAAPEAAAEMRESPPYSGHSPR